MAKLGFSRDDDDLPIRALYARKCKKRAGRGESHDAGQHGTESEEGDETYSPPEGSDDGTDGTDNYEDESDEVRGPEEGTSCGRGANGDDSASVTLADPDVLDCPICLESLSLPVFQCENGHIACSSCCTKIKNSCPSCSWPIGYNRCRALEKVLESAKVSCGNRPYGCDENVTYSKKHDHEATCKFVPCSCPHSDCNFRGSFRQLAHHFQSQHQNSLTKFSYNMAFLVTLEFYAGDKFRILEEADEGSLFIVSGFAQQFGHALTICSIGAASSEGGHEFNLKALGDGKASVLQSVTENITEVVDLPSVSRGFLGIPSAFMDSGRLHLELRIVGNSIHPPKKRKSSCV